MTTLVTKVGIALVVLLAPLRARAATYYVSPSGSDSAAGSMAAPFASWARAQTSASAGDTVYFRGGTYKYTEATATCGGSTSASIAAVVLTKSGTSGKPISYVAFEGEKPSFDFSGITNKDKYNCRQIGVHVQADWLYLKGLEFSGVLQLNNLNHESWGVYIDGGSNNTFELLDSHHQMGPGFFIVQGGHNTFLNCDSHENEDPLTSNGDGQSADGFGCHPKKSGDTGNLFHGCRAWWNTDDGWDFINASAPCTVEYSWAWYSGYKPDQLSNGAPVSLAAGNGNGIKAGGYGDPQDNVPSPIPQHVARFNVSFYNKAAGFYANHHPVSPYFYNNTAFNNGVDYDMLGLNGTTVTSVGIYRNNVAFSTLGKAATRNGTNTGPISDMVNSWDASLGITVKAADFQSVDFKPATSCPPTDKTCFAGMASARKPDGSLPDLPFLRLASGSQLIDKGVDVGLKYVGKAPDLGGFESGASDPGVGGSPAGGAAGGGALAGSGGAAASAAGAASGAEAGSTGTDESSAGGPTLGGSAGAGFSQAGAPGAAGTSSGIAGNGSAGGPVHPSSDTDAGCSCGVGAGNARSGAALVFAALLLSMAGYGRRWRRRRVRAPLSLR